MVEGALVVDACIQAVGAQQPDDLSRQLWVARCGVLHGKQLAGKPPKSCQVSGAALPLTSKSWLSQCADTTTIALGRGISAARRCKAGPLAPG